MANLAKLISFLLRSAEGARSSRLAVFLFLIAGITAGLASTGLLAVINAALTASDLADTDLAWIFLGLCALLPIARFLSQVLLVRITQGVTYDLRVNLSRRILAAPLRHLEELGAHRLLATLTDDIASITGTLGNLPLIFLQMTVLVSAFAYMGWLSWQLLLLVLAVVAVGLISYQIPMVRAVRYFRMSRESWDELFGHFNALTRGTKELKTHSDRRNAFFGARLEPAAARLRDQNVRGGVIQAVASSWGQILFFVVIGLLIFVVPRYVEVSVRTLSGFTLAILYMLTAVDVVLNMIPMLARAVVAIDKVERLGLSLEGNGSENLTASGALSSSWHSLELDRMTHTYRREGQDDSFVLGPLDLRLVPGELIFLVGGNGSGKTTFAKLLLGLYTPENGSIRLDGRPVDDASRESYRQLFSAVFSDFFLFDTLLGLGGGEMDESARRYLHQLHLERKVKIEGGGLSTIDLSQGQRKRLALLTAYLEDRPIYLFDEWAADQDPYFKEIFYLQLLPELRRRGKTVIAITHDDRYYPVADRLIKLDYGTIVFDGRASEYKTEVVSFPTPVASHHAQSESGV
jgi:putative pyoverdin transport system ATP-binding/permease protein